MKRTGFQKPQRERRPVLVVPITQPVHALRIDTEARASVPVPKFAYTRSPSLLKACRLIPCQHCGAADGTVVAAHSNWSEHGKGRSVKASDVFVASLCHRCHGELDQGASLTREQRRTMWQAAHRKTVAELKARGLWPAELPVPDNTTNGGIHP